MLERIATHGFDGVTHDLLNAGNGHVRILSYVIGQDEAMDWSQLTLPLGVLVAAFALMPYFTKAAENSNQRLQDWAKSEGATIISQRQARFYEGPNVWRRHEYENTYRLEVRDAKGRVRTAWVTVGDHKVMFETNPEVTNVTWG